MQIVSVSSARRLTEGLNPVSINKSGGNKGGERTRGNDLHARGGVETTGGLVEDEHAGSGDHRASDRNSPLLSARNSTLQRCSDAVVGDVLESERLERVVDVLLQANKVAREPGELN